MKLHFKNHDEPLADSRCMNVQTKARPIHVSNNYNSAMSPLHLYGTGRAATMRFLFSEVTNSSSMQVKGCNVDCNLKHQKINVLQNVSPSSAILLITHGKLRSFSFFCTITSPFLYSEWLSLCYSPLCSMLMNFINLYRFSTQ